MSDEASFAATDLPPRDPSIDSADEGQLKLWAKKLDVSDQQVRDAIQAVGPAASDVEEYLKGSRATTNAEQTKAAGR